MQEHHFSFDVDATPEEVWAVAASATASGASH